MLLIHNINDNANINLSIEMSNLMQSNINNKKKGSELMANFNDARAEVLA